MMFSGGLFSSNDVARAIVAPALLRATSNIFAELFSDGKLAQKLEISKHVKISRTRHWRMHTGADMERTWSEYPSLNMRNRKKRW